MKPCKCTRTHEVENFSSKGKRKTCTQCLDCGMYTFPCPGGHHVSKGYCMNCGQFSPVLKLREDSLQPTGTESTLILSQPLFFNPGTCAPRD